MRSILFWLIATILLFPTASIASKGIYLNIKTGATFSGELKASVAPYQVPSSPIFAMPALNIPAHTIETEYEEGPSISGAVGYDFGCFRLEGELGYSKNDVDYFIQPILSIALPLPPATEVGAVVLRTEKTDGSGSIKIYNLMLNGYFDIQNKTIFTPFLMGGIGGVKISIDDFWRKDNDTVIAYKIGAGVSTTLNKRLTLDIEYQYFTTEDLKFNGKFMNERITADLESHSATLGLRYYF